MHPVELHSKNNKESVYILPVFISCIDWSVHYVSNHRFKSILAKFSGRQTFEIEVHLDITNSARERFGHQGEKNSYGSRVIALSSLGYKVEILRSSSRVIDSIDTRKFHGDELQKPIPRPNPCDHFRFLFRTPDWREWRPCPAKKWRQRCPDFSIVIVIRLGETSVWYRQEMEYYADYDSFVVF